MIKTIIRIITLAGMILVYAMLNVWLGIHVELINTALISTSILIVVFQILECRPTFRSRSKKDKE